METEFRAQREGTGRSFLEEDKQSGLTLAGANTNPASLDYSHRPMGELTSATQVRMPKPRQRTSTTQSLQDFGKCCKKARRAAPIVAHMGANISHLRLHFLPCERKAQIPALL